MRFAYLGVLVLSLAGVTALDRRFRLAWWRAPRRTLLVSLVGTAFFLVWDLTGIAAGVFLRGSSTALTGIDLAPHLPVEELVFLFFLSYLTVVAYSALTVLSRRDAP